MTPTDIRTVLQEFPAIHAYRDTAVTTTTGATLSVDLDKERYTRAGVLHSLSVVPSEITVVMPGVWRITGFVEWAFSALGTRYLSIQVNGVSRANDTHPPDAVYIISQGATVEWLCAPGDIVRIRAVQNSGGNLNIAAAFLTLSRIGD
jgi:hypothetical protein